MRGAGTRLFIITLLTGMLYANAAVGDVSISKLSSLGIKFAPCPNYIAHLRGGIATSVLKPTTLCVKSGDLAKASKYLFKRRMVLDGSFQAGTAFAGIYGQEGDVQTLPFEVVNFPAEISFYIDNANDKSRFEISIINADTNKSINSYVRARGSGQGHVAWAYPGRYYLKIQAVGDPQEELQPVFDVTMQYMDTPFGFSVTRDDMKTSGLRTMPCPKALVDIKTGNTYAIGKKFVCTKAGGEAVTDAGFSLAPLNLGHTIFLADALDDFGCGDSLWLPFRVTRPRYMDYSVDDPTSGKGSLSMNLYEFTANHKVTPTLVQVKGSIMGTTTSMNAPGDYYILGRANSSNPEANGEMCWDYSIDEEF
ncbi:MAG: hypothetical protein K1X83_08365 [Oligoflexia bacterium]|nr:hypothetical protein [Oligoflexia bacterium]